MHTVSPFINFHSIARTMTEQQMAFRKKMDKIEKEADFFNMIFAEIDEDDSEDEGHGLFHKDD